MVANLDAEIGNVLGRGGTHIDICLVDSRNHILHSLWREVVRGSAHHTGDQRAVVGTNFDDTAGQHTLGNPTKANNTDESVWFHLGDDHAELIGVSKDHDSLVSGLCCLKPRHDVAKRIDRDVFRESTEVSLDGLDHRLFPA